MTIHRVPQRSPEWFALRAGRLTASCADDVLAKGKKGEEAYKRRDLRLRLAAERLTGIPEAGGYVNADMQRGIDKEPDAVSLYEVRTGAMVDTSVGFMASDDCMAGYSPDGLVGDGLLETKCPKTATHLGYLRHPSSLVDDYMAQILHGLWISGAPWLDIVSFDDRLPENISLVVCRVDNTGVNDYALAATLFLREVDATVEELLALGAR